MRQVLSTILALLQLAPVFAIPHSHGAAGQPADHDHRQHIHLGGCVSHHHGEAEHTHPHPHPHPHPHHHHDEWCLNQETSPESPPQSDHESDAVYLPDEAVAGPGTPGSDPETCQALPRLHEPTLMVRTLPPALTPPWALPPPLGCPLYLRTLTLLI